ncbi:hypothetical protein Acr_24g0014110 [Actinidia rufa]|uniref:Uncharacterized protein n=1 Tax=Actinidia rufa TaxID=165716 RepID=A0A7J0GWV4_9ERIC|nr:hypothetical protein Acr_24g0014110 [Actinidia rufa]
MALTLHSTPFLLTQKPHLLHTKTTPFAIKSQDSSSTSNPSSPSTDPPKPTSQGLGFGSSSSNSPKPKPNPVGIKKKQRGKGERASIIRRAPVEKPEFVSQQEEPLSKEQIRNENAFLLAWLGLGGVILVEGIALAASVECSALKIIALAYILSWGSFILSLAGIRRIKAHTVAEARTSICFSGHEVDSRIAVSHHVPAFADEVSEWGSLVLSFMNDFHHALESNSISVELIPSFITKLRPP